MSKNKIFAFFRVFSLLKQKKPSGLLPGGNPLYFDFSPVLR